MSYYDYGMRGLAVQSLAFLAGAFLALPPSACCLIGKDSCCTRAKAEKIAANAEATPLRSCCQRHTAQVPADGNCQEHGAPAKAPVPTSPQLCCCVKTAVPVGPMVSVSHDLSLTPFAVVEPILVSTAATSRIFAVPVCDVSPPLHVRLCVWRC